MLSGCPSATRQFANLVTGEMVDDRCRRNCCPFCCMILADQIAKAIKRAKPVWLVTYTLVGDNWVTCKDSINRVTTKVRAKGYAREHCYTVEPNSEDTGLHVHAWVHGDVVPEHVLNGVCADVGIGKPDVRRLDYDGPQFYGVKRAQSDDTRADHLALNGGRLVHSSRRFFRDQGGNPCSMQVAIGRRSSESDSPWVLLRRPTGAQAGGHRHPGSPSLAR